jgi:adenylate cyclase
MIKRILLSPWTALLTLAVVVGLRITDGSFIESVRLRYFDQLITSQPARTADIHTINIDEATVARYGQYPFSRDIYAEIIQELYRRNAGLVVFNVLMPEQDRFKQDAALAKLMTQVPVVLPNAGDTNAKNTPRAPGSVVIGGDPTGVIVTYPGIIANTAVLESAAAGVGIINTFPEIDGVVRRAPLIIAVDGKLYPSLAMETLRVAAGDSTFQVKINENGVEKMRIPQFGPVATDSLGRVWIDWSIVSTSHSAVDLPADFKGSIVIVGVTARGLANPVATAKGEVWPQDLQAALLGTMIAKTNIERPDWADAGEIAALTLLGVVLLFLTRWTYVGLIAGIIFLGGIVYGSIYYYDIHRWLLDSTGIVSGLVLVLLHAYGVKFVSEFLQKQQIKRQFGTYLSPAMVEKLQRNPELLTLGGESRELSIMFTDVRGFTTISEHYGKDVQGLTRIMNRYMTAMTAKIIENEGTLDKYIGDAQMAFWNAPLDDENHAKNAVRTGLQMMGSLDAFNQEVTAEGIPAFGMGLGINTDTVVVGNMGSSQRFDYTCLGDGVNLAARLEGQSKPYGVKIVLGPKTAEQVMDEFFVLELDKIAVKGKRVGVTIYTVLELHPGAHGEYEMARSDHEEMLVAYRKRHFEHAIFLCDTLTGEFDGQMDGYYEAWKDRCREMKLAKLPPDWDGTFTATSK